MNADKCNKTIEEVNSSITKLMTINKWFDDKYADMEKADVEVASYEITKEQIIEITGKITDAIGYLNRYSATLINTMNNTELPNYIV